jgi:hypothetical protein
MQAFLMKLILKIKNIYQENDLSYLDYSLNILLGVLNLKVLLEKILQICMLPDHLLLMISYLHLKIV